MTDQWTFRENARNRDVFSFLSCVADIADTISSVRDSTKDPDLSITGDTTMALETAASVRRISLPLRKLLLDKNGQLFKDCLTCPNLHPLKHPPSNQRGHIFIEKFEQKTMKLTWSKTKEAKERKETLLEIPKYEHRTVVSPLYGITYHSNHDFLMETPFDDNVPPIKFKAWMKTKVLQINKTIFSARDLLREIVNNEGAHIGDGTAMSLPDASSIEMGELEREKYRIINSVKFGGFSYGQHFTFCTGLYIANRSRALIDNLPFNKNSEAIARICKK